MTLPSSRPLAAAGTEVEDDPWDRPAGFLRAAGAEAVTQTLEVDSEAYGQLQALAGLDRVCRTIARGIRVEREIIIRHIVAEHGVRFVAGYLELDESTVRRIAPSGRTRRPSTTKGQERQVVDLYAVGHSIDAVSKRLNIGHRRVKRVLLAAGIPLRLTFDRGPQRGDEDGA